MEGDPFFAELASPSLAETDPPVNETQEVRENRRRPQRDTSERGNKGPTNLKSFKHFVDQGLHLVNLLMVVSPVKMKSKHIVMLLVLFLSYS